MPHNIGKPCRANATRMCSPSEITITQPDDWHLHLRDGAGMASAAPHSAAVFHCAIIMPNLVPPVTTAAAATSYRRRIVDALPSDATFNPLMTCYLTDNTTPDDVKAAQDAGVVAFKLYPAGATTNSDSGVTHISKVESTLRAMAELGMVLCVHGEATDPDIDIFDREKVFIQRTLGPLLERMQGLRVVMEHITTRDAADFVRTAGTTLAATITPQHMLHNRNALFNKGLRPHNWCLPVLKREEHRQAVAEAATSGGECFFLGTDSAPHPRGAKESACGCAGIFSAPAALPLYAEAFERAGALDKLDAFAGKHGPKFYKLPCNSAQVTLRREQWDSTR